MGVPQNMRSETEIELQGVDLTEMIDVTIRASQDELFLNPTATVINENTVIMGINLEEAAELVKNRPIQVQVLYTNKDGKPGYSEIDTIRVDEVLGGAYGI